MWQSWVLNVVLKWEHSGPPTPQAVKGDKAQVNQMGMTLIPKQERNEEFRGREVEKLPHVKRLTHPPSQTYTLDIIVNI